MTLLAALIALYVAGTADAGPTRCQQHRLDARERAGIVSGIGSGDASGTGQRVLVIGDSWSVGLAQDDLADSWPSRLPGEVHVRGFSGSGFTERASRCGRVSFHDRARAALGVRPDLVVVEGGLNDYDQPDVAIDRGFRALMADLAGQRVVVVGPADAPARSGAVPRVDARLRMLSEQYGVPYVATNDLTLDYVDDRLHLTEEGHRRFGDAVAARIAAVTPARPAVLVR